MNYKGYTIEQVDGAGFCVYFNGVLVDDGLRSVDAAKRSIDEIA